MFLVCLGLAVGLSWNACVSCISSVPGSERGLGMPKKRQVPEGLQPLGHTWPVAERWRGKAQMGAVWSGAWEGGSVGRGRGTQATVWLSPGYLST